MINLNEINAKVIEEMLLNNGAERQTLNIKSKKPAVIHKTHSQISFVVSGDGYAQVDDEVLNIKRGSLIIIPQNTAHSFLCINGNMKLLHLHNPKISGDEDWFMLEEISKKWKKYL